MDLVTYIENYFSRQTGSKRDLSLLVIEPAFQFTLEEVLSVDRGGEEDE